MSYWCSRENEFQITGPNFLWPCANSRMLIQHKVEEAILMSLMNENHLVMSFHCLAFNPRRLILQAKVGGQALFRSSQSQVFYFRQFASKFLQLLRCMNILIKVSQFSFPGTQGCQQFWFSTSRITVKKMDHSWY